MKQKRKNIFKKILIFGIAVMLASCSEELFDEAIESSNKASIKEVRFNELYKDSKFKNLLEKVSHNSNAARTSFENQNGFTISDGFVKVIETDSVTSYTMLIERDVVTNTISFENLVIQENSLGVQKAKILKYTPTIIELSGHNSYFFEGNIQMNRLAFTGFNKSSSNSNTTQGECFAFVDQLWCSQPYDGSTRHHLAGAGCKIGTLYVKKVLVPDDCGSTGGDNSGSTGGPPDGGLGDPYGNNGLGGGPANGNPNNNTANPDSEQEQELVTSPVKPGLDGVIPAEKTPCEDLQYKDQDSVFNLKMTDLKNKAANQGFESAHAINQNAGEGLLVGPEFTGDPNGASNGREVTLQLGSSIYAVAANCIGFIHCHLDDGTTYKVFSFSDIYALAQIASISTRPKTEFAIYVTTSSGTFALKVNNKILLKNKKDFMDVGWKEFEDMFKEKVRMDDSYDKQKLGFMKFINKMPYNIGNPGIDMYEKVNGTWNKLGLSSNGNNVTSTPCN